MPAVPAYSFFTAIWVRAKPRLSNRFAPQLGVSDSVTSPTFSIVNEYKGNDGPVYHFDFYRLKDQSEALDMGYEEYFYSGNYCFIEWPEKIANLIPILYRRTDPGVRCNLKANNS
jgi:tRNA threonylcarbamoyladenosine biosynthesis protein TsaE